MTEIELGDKVEDIVTGYVGIVVALTTFLNGCQQATIIKRLAKGESMTSLTDYPSVDTQSLRIIKKKAIDVNKKDEVKPKKERTGGAMNFFRRGNFR